MRKTMVLPILIIFLGYLLIIAGSSTGLTEEAPLSEWAVSNDLQKQYNLEHLPNQSFFYKDQLYTGTLINGQIVIGKFSDDQWNEIQRLSIKESRFTTLHVQDFNGDFQPEIIAGTVEPGFLYIYKLNEADQWIVCDNSKYLWSTITQIACGNFSGIAQTEFIVQNSEGSLFYLKRVNNALNIVWKSPAPWRSIKSFRIVDIDHDLSEEILITFQTGGLAILKIEKNAVVSLWENYPWGKILSTSSGDWNHDGIQEIVVTTSQKMIYLLSYSGKKFSFEKAPLQLGYLIENMHFVDSDSLEVIAGDASGKIHFLAYDSKQKNWMEKQAIHTGRITEIIASPDSKEFWMWGMNRQMIIFKKTATMVLP